MNTLASKVMKAELMGNDDLAAELKLKLDAARNARAEMIANGINPDQGTEVVTKIRGEDMRKKRKKTKVETHKDGERVRYLVMMTSMTSNRCLKEKKWTPQKIITR